MANWAWPHTPVDTWAKLLLVGGPFDGDVAGFLPPHIGAPLEVAWTGWMPWGFQCYRYVHKQGDVQLCHGRTRGLYYRFDPTPIAARDIPPIVAHEADVYADAADLLIRMVGFPGIQQGGVDMRRR